MNNQIQAAELRVVTDAGENLGVMSLSQALKAALERGLDLIEIAPMAKPPVAKIIGFDKFRYQQEKEEKKRRTMQKAKELKQVRITPRAAQNDLMVKVKRVEEFLAGGHKVEIGLFLKGREKGNKDWGLQKLKEFLKMITTPHLVTLPPKQGGRGFITQIAKK
ncbi:MAG: translation initiation factor IF-3 [bacterium]